MRNSKRVTRVCVSAAAALFVLAGSPFAQRTGYSWQEFINRRTALMDSVKDGIIVLFAEARYERSAGLTPGAHFRQDNDYYYFSGNEDWNSILVMVPRTKQSYLFLPEQTDREILADGANWLKDEQTRMSTGLSNIFPLSQFDEFISGAIVRQGKTLHLRLMPRGTLTAQARRTKTPYNDQISLESYRIREFKDRYPFAEIRDVTPFIDALRVIKSPEEIEIIRRCGRISAEGVRQAMLATKPGAYEYEVEAAALSVIRRNGAKGAGYPPIVGAGLNTCTLHYWKNSARIEDGDLVLMDFGGDLDYLMVDITRTWPASGRFSDEQRRLYQIVLEVQKACIEAYRPGATVKDVQKHVAQVMKRKGISVPQEIAHVGTYPDIGGFGHYVGMTVHDVGPAGVPLREGMVFAIEPAIYIPEKKIGIRIEDTVLITKTGCEVLTKDVPKEIEDIEKLMAQRTRTGG